MNMHNPPHPGEFIKATYLDPLNISSREAAEKLNVAPSTFSRLIRGDSNISSEMALKLSKAFGRSAESWLLMQNIYDLWVTRKSINLDKVGVIHQRSRNKAA